jgi:hypothetical protein
MLNHSESLPTKNRQVAVPLPSRSAKDVPAASDDRHFVASVLGTLRRVPMTESRRICDNEHQTCTSRERRVTGAEMATCPAIASTKRPAKSGAFAPQFLRLRQSFSFAASQTSRMPKVRARQKVERERDETVNAAIMRLFNRSPICLRDKEPIHRIVLPDRGCIITPIDSCSHFASTVQNRRELSHVR